MSGPILAGTFFTMGHGQELARSMDQNQVDVLVLTPQEYLCILEDKSKGNPRLEASLRQILADTCFGKYWKTTLFPNINEPWLGPIAQSAVDAMAVTQTFKALGMAGLTSYIKTTPKGTYIIIKGFPARRSGVLTGTRYLAGHPLMMKLGLGIKSLKGIAKGGFILGVVVSAGIELTDFMFNDERTMYDLIGGIGAEAIKGGLAALIAYGVAGALGTAMAVAVTPLVIMAVVAVTVSIGLNILDNEIEFKANVIKILKKASDGTALGIYKVNQASRSWLQDWTDTVQAKLSAEQRKIERQMYDWMCPVCRRF